MIAIIFAAGIGSRLKPFTDSHPKALAPVAGVPALVRVATKLREAGARKIIVNVHHFASQVEECLAHLPFARDIEVSDERELLLDTGGALAKIWRENTTVRSAAPDEDIVVHNADIITDFDIASMVAGRRAAQADAAILVDPHRESTRRFLFDADGRLRGWQNIPKGLTRPEGLDTAGLTGAPFGGVHVLTPEMLKELSDYGPEPLAPFSIVDWYLDNCNNRRIQAFTPQRPYRWHDIGTPEKLAAADAAFS